MRDDRSCVALLVILLAIAYILWPIDAIPDVIPVVGWIDDLAVGCGMYLSHRRLRWLIPIWPRLDEGTRTRLV